MGRIAGNPVGTMLAVGLSGLSTLWGLLDKTLWVPGGVLSLGARMTMAKIKHDDWRLYGREL